MKLLICFILALTSLTAGTRTPRFGKLGQATSRIGTGARDRSGQLTKKRYRRKVSGSIEWCASCERDARGRIVRSAAARRAFRRANPCPSTGQTTGACPGYVVDHIQALKRGGLDKAGNMQWQSTEAAKEKDRTE
jgi:hypothetical protein